MSSPSTSDGAREQRALGVVFVVIFVGIFFEWHRQDRASRAARTATARAPGEHRTSKRSECLRCTGPLLSPLQCNNISMRQYRGILRYILVDTHTNHNVLWRSFLKDVTVTLSHEWSFNCLTVVSRDKKHVAGFFIWGRCARADSRHYYHKTNTVVSHAHISGEPRPRTHDCSLMHL